MYIEISAFQWVWPILQFSSSHFQGGEGKAWILKKSLFHSQALIHVSTAYCNCDREEVREIIYSPPYDPQKIIETMDWMDDGLVDTLTPRWELLL